MNATLNGLALASLLFTGAIFGFFYAWICSTMWGLDAADPHIAISAMQSMNASVRNAVFAPAFFGTPLVLGMTALLALVSGKRTSASFFGAGALLYLFGGLILTLSINVPMNEKLASIAVPEDIDTAKTIWAEYSGPWQFWNMVRTLASGGALVLAGAGAIRLR